MEHVLAPKLPTLLIELILAPKLPILLIELILSPKLPTLLPELCLAFVLRDNQDQGTMKKKINCVILFT